MTVNEVSPHLRLSASAASLVELPWHEPLRDWSAPEVHLVDAPLAAGRHVVRVVQHDGRRWALKELPAWAAEREHAALLHLQRGGVPAVRPAGLVTRQADGAAVLVTEYVPDSIPWRTLLSGSADDAQVHRARVHEAVAVFVVDLHRQGVFWGDCSLSNLLFRRDGHDLQPLLVDAETAEVRPSLTDGQRRHDLDILQDNLFGGLLDLAAELGRPEDLDALALEARGVASRYEQVWRTIHASPTLPYGRRQDAVEEVGRLNDLGYAVDELRLTSTPGDRDELRLHTSVADRRHHATVLRHRTGLAVGEGQAKVLLEDLRSHTAAHPDLPERSAVGSWREWVVLPALDRLQAALPASEDLVQDYCDLLETRWLLSERAGRDVGDVAAVEVLVAARAGAVQRPGSVAPATPFRWPLHQRTA